jgi:3-oxoacyl-(acyl-carrier-protein) synthase
VRRVAIFGWGIVAPRSPSIERFAANLEGAESWLSPFGGFGRDNFLVGTPEFRFDGYKPWIDARFRPTRYRQLTEKMDPSSLYAIGSFIQALETNPGLEDELERLGSAAHVYFGTGLGSLPTISRATLDLYRAQRRWNRFWADPARNGALAAHLATPPAERPEGGVAGGEVPADPAAAAAGDRDEAEEAWWAYWAPRSAELER